MISHTMLISDILSTYPDAVIVFERHGLACGKCLAAGMESLDAVAGAHDVDLEVFMADLNDFIVTLNDLDQGE